MYHQSRAESDKQILRWERSRFEVQIFRTSNKSTAEEWIRSVAEGKEKELQQRSK